MAVNPERGMEKMEENMKIKDFIKNVAAPIVMTILLMAFFRPVCTRNGECNYVMLWFLMGIPVGLGHLFFLVVPKGYDTGGAMSVLFLNLVMASVTGVAILTFRLLTAAVCLVGVMGSGINRLLRMGCRKR